MDCHDAKERVREERLTTAVRRHLARCSDCTSFVGELDSGGRQIGEAFLAGSPSPGFEDRVAHRLAEREIAVTAGRRRPLVAFLVAALLLLIAGAGYLLMNRGRPVIVAPPSDPPAEVAVVTRPVEENVLNLLLDREESTSPTRLEMDFAGIREEALLSEDVEDAIFRLWARGARRARLVVGPKVPGRDMFAVQESLEKAGFAFTLSREKTPRIP